MFYSIIIYIYHYLLAIVIKIVNLNIIKNTMIKYYTHVIIVINKNLLYAYANAIAFNR